jgi:replicative DNA helicase
MIKNQNSIDSEYAVIGGLLRDNSKFQELDITQDDFFDENLGIVFDAIEYQLKNNQPADPITTAEFLYSRTQKNWLPLITQTFENTPSAANTVAYGKYVKEMSVKRRASALGERLQGEIWINPDVVDEVMRELMQLNQGRKSYECSLQSAVGLALEYLDEVQQNKGKLTGITTGLKDLDEMLGGYHKRDLICIGARPAMGKTAFMLNSVEKADVPVGIITGEQGRNQIAQRMLMINGRINSYRMRLGKLTEMDWQNIIESSIRLNKMQGWLYDKSRPNILDIERQARKWSFHHNIKLLWIDYLQRVKINSKAPKHERIEEIAQNLNSIGEELDIPVCALCQINRDVEKRPDKRPLMADFKDSGAIEQEADIMVTLYRDEVYNKETVDKGIAEIGVPKNRHGPEGRIKTLWEGQYMTFKNYREDDPGY